MKKTLGFALSIAVLSMLAVSCGTKGKKEAVEAEQKAQEEAAIIEATMNKLATLAEEPVFDIETNYGTIRVRLYSGTPKHRENFAKLALSSYYDGLLFHRVIKGFMIQGGDPLTKNPENAAKYGTGGPDYTVPAEFVPEYTHKYGALAAARRGDAANPTKASSGSQFYIVQDEANCAQLDGQYTVFGETIDGFKTIEAIAAVQTNTRDCPIEDVKIISVKLVEE